VFGSSAITPRSPIQQSVPSSSPPLRCFAQRAHKLFVGGGVNMIGAARPLTWITDVVPMKDLAVAIAAGGAGSALAPDRRRPP